jgi:hypothetical protein
MSIETSPLGIRGVVDPRDCVFAVIDDPLLALQAVHALYGAGFHEEDVVVAGLDRFSGDEIQGANRHSLDRLFAAMDALHDPGAFAERYLDHVHLGHCVMQVYAPSPHRFERAMSVLESYRAHAV